ncbi:hypothetical protein Tco_1138273 [Tanacetum coccineum]
MADKGKKSSMETFAPNDIADYYFEITSITVNGKNAYELKGKFLDDLHNNAFSGTNREDAKMGGDEIEVSDDEYSDLEEYWSDKEEETAEIFKIETNVFDYEIPICLAFSEFNYLLKVYDKPWLDNGIWKEPKPVKHDCKPFNYKTRYLEWYEALEDSELKDKALRNKAIMKGSISGEKSCNDGWRRWESHEITYHDHDEIENETHDERQELCEAHELPVCNIRRFKMIKYSFGQDEEYVVVKEDEYEDLARISNEACRAYQEIFRIMEKGWMVTRAE